MFSDVPVNFMDTFQDVALCSDVYPLVCRYLGYPTLEVGMLLRMVPRDHAIHDVTGHEYILGILRLGDADGSTPINVFCYFVFTNKNLL